MMNQISLSKSSRAFNINIENNLENMEPIILIDFYIDQIKEGVWQGICKFRVDGEELAAVSVTKNLSNLTNDLMQKIRIQLPTEYKVQAHDSIYSEIYSV